MNMCEIYNNIQTMDIDGINWMLNVWLCFSYFWDDDDAI